MLTLLTHAMQFLVILYEKFSYLLVKELFHALYLLKPTLKKSFLWKQIHLKISEIQGTKKA